MDKFTIIKLMNQGHSDRKIARDAGIDRKTVAKYRKQHQSLLERLQLGDDLRTIQEELTASPTYDTSRRYPVKYTKEIDEELDRILKSESGKNEVLGNHKQKLTNEAICEMIKAQGYDIGRSTICRHIKEKRENAKEAFIRQEYELGDRLEYDFGEVKLEIDGMVGTYYMAVFGSPAGKHRWAYLYDNQKKEVFMDSHVRYFDWVGGIFKEVVYDNMKNVVTKFLGKNEKMLNEDLIKMSIYYGFEINVTNCYSGNEKGYVENSVKVVRKEAFAHRYRFESLKDAEEYLHQRLEILNGDSRLEEERRLLKAAKPPLELGKISKQRVDKYSFVRVENNFYSVPDHLVGHEVTIKNYLREIEVYADSGKVCTHKKIDGFSQTQVDIFHYLGTLEKKPGALKNSKALKSRAELKTIYDEHFTKRTKEFIGILKENQEKGYEALLTLLVAAAKDQTLYRSSTDSTIEDHIHKKTKDGLSQLSQLFMKGGQEYVN